MSIFISFDIGINANGSEELAKLMIKAAAEAGADLVKFQKRSVDKVYTKEFLASPRESPWGKTQGDQKWALEFTRRQYEEIDRYCKELGIAWTASAWDLDSQEFIHSFNVPFNKVASPMLGNKPLLRKIASEKKKTFISTGMSKLKELDEVVELFTRAHCEFELMHCVSNYPMPEHEANLNCIPMLRERYNCNVGYSGHETSLIKVCVAAVTLGATSIERHISLDRAMYGSDQAASIETHDLKNFVEVIRQVPLMLGTGIKDVTESEWPARKKLRVEIA